MYQDTSREAYESLDIGKRQKTVLEFIRNHPHCCNIDIADGLGWSINRVTPRVLELRDMNKVRFSGKKMSSTGRTAMTWVVVEVQKELF